MGLEDRNAPTSGISPMTFAGVSVMIAGIALFSLILNYGERSARRKQLQKIEKANGITPEQRADLLADLESVLEKKAQQLEAEAKGQLGGLISAVDKLSSEREVGLLPLKKRLKSIEDELAGAAKGTALANRLRDELTALSEDAVRGKAFDEALAPLKKTAAATTDELAELKASLTGVKGAGTRAAKTRRALANDLQALGQQVAALQAADKAQGQAARTAHDGMEGRIADLAKQIAQLNKQLADAKTAAAASGKAAAAADGRAAASGKAAVAAEARAKAAEARAVAAETAAAAAKQRADAASKAAAATRGAVAKLEARLKALEAKQPK